MKFSKISGKIHINNNWTSAKSAGICTGNGTYSEPYVIEDLVIDGGGSGSCILIENSSAFFKIENCSLYNDGSFPYAKIRFNRVNNSIISNTTCTDDSYCGICLSDSNNNTVSGNIVNNNFIGIYLRNSHNNTVSGNIANNNVNGIELGNSYNNTISGNKMIKCGLAFSENREMLLSNEIDTT